MWVGRLAAILFLVAIPGFASQVEGFGAHDLSRVAQVMVSATCALCLASRAAIERNQRRWAGPPILGVIAIGLLALASVLHAPDTKAAARELAMVLGLAGIAGVVASCQAKEQLEALVIAVVAAAGLYVCLVLLNLFITIARAGPLDRFSVILGYDNYRLFNHVQTVVLPLLIIATSRSFRRGEFARLAWFSLTMNFALLIFTQGRATAVAVIGAVVLILLLLRSAALPRVGHLVTGATTGALAYLGMFVLLPSLTGSLAEALAPEGLASLQSDHSRLMLWRLALDYIAQDPWLGIGPMHYAHYVNPKAAHPHNIYLQVASEWGVPMLVMLLAWSTWAASRMASAIKACTDPEQANIGIGFFIAVIAIAVDGMFSGNFVIPVSQVWIAFAIGGAIAWTRLNAPLSASIVHPDSQRRLRASVAALLVASQVWLGWSISPELLNLNAHLDHVRHSNATSAKACPRFWSNGWF